MSKRILVITLSNIGDIILTTPVVEALLSEFPGSKLDVMVGPSGRGLFASHEKVREVIIYDKKSSSFAKFMLFVRLWKKRYNLVVDLRNTVLPFVLGARHATYPFHYRRRPEMHKRDAHLLRLKEVGIDAPKSELFIPVNDDDKKYVENLLSALQEKPFIAVSPGAKSHVKRWPLKNFAVLCDRIKKELKLEVILVGDEYDRVVIDRILFYMKTKPTNFIEKTNINQLACLIGKAKLLITNDSAPLHAASAVGARILAFFGPTDDKKYGPVTKAPSVVLRKNIKCAPCEVPQCINFDNKYECLKTITVDETFEAVKKLCAYS